MLTCRPGDGDWDTSQEYNLNSVQRPSGAPFWVGEFTSGFPEVIGEEKLPRTDDNLYLRGSTTSTNGGRVDFKVDGGKHFTGQ